MIKVSCVLPIYNGEKYLNNTLLSLLNQSLREIEIICVNDCSSDNTYSVLLEKQKNDGRIIIINELEHKGAAVCRNIGFSKAKGDYVIFLDADDYFFEDMLENAYNLAIDKDAELVVFGYEEIRIAIDDFGNEINVNKIIHQNRYEELLNSEVDIGTIKKVEGIPWNKMVKRNFLKQKSIMFQDIPRNNDIFFAIAVTMRAKKIVISDSISLKYYYGRNDSLSFKRFNKKSYLIAAYVRLLDYINAHHIDNISTKDMLSYFLDNIAVHFASHEYSKSVKEDTYKQLLGNTLLMNLIEESVRQEELLPHNIAFGKAVLEHDSVADKNNYVYYLGEIRPLFNQARRNGEKIALWGCGVLGKRFLDMLNDEDIKIDYVVDCDKVKQGTYYGGYLIYNYYTVEDKINMILVLNSKHVDDIKKIAANKSIIDVNDL